MLKILIRSRLRDKKELVISLLSIILASVLMFTVSLVFSSVYGYAIDVYDGYTVIVEGKLEGYDEYLKNGDYYLNFKPSEVYDKTEELCQVHECDKVTYNTKLLSLYAIGESNYLRVIKNILIFVLLIISISVFFIIYNSFRVSFLHRKRDIITMRAIGIDSRNLILISLIERIILSLFGILIGFVLAVLFTNLIILVLNDLLREIIQGKIRIRFNLSFIVISILFILGVTLISAFLAALGLRKYQIMDGFREEGPAQEKINYKIDKNIPIYFALTNFERDRKRYRPLTVSIFILTFLICVFSSFLSYVKYGTSNYVISPDYDVSISSYEDLSYIKKDINVKKMVSFRSCSLESYLDGSYYSVLVTDLGGDEVINRVIDIKEVGEKFERVDNSLFEGPITLGLNGNYYDLVLSDKIPFGFNDKLKAGNLVVNLDEKNFDAVCEVDSYNLILNTESNIDDYLKDKTFSYFNAKKAREITNNLILGINFVLYGMTLLLWMVFLSSVISILSLCMDFRVKYFSLLKSLGFTSFFKVLGYEALNIALRGFIYSVPFIFLADRFLYECAALVFDDTRLILNVHVLVLSFIFNFLVILFIFGVMHKKFFKRSLASNLR